MALSMLPLLMAAACFYVLFEKEWRQAVLGSYERYRANSLALVAALISLVVNLLIALLLNHGGNHFVAAILMAGVAGWLYRINEHLSDDNWFDDLQQRLGDAIIRLGERIAGGKTVAQTTQPRPS